MVAAILTTATVLAAATMNVTSSGSSIVLAAIEGGGTSFRVAVAACSEGSHETPVLLHRTSIDSSHDDPDRTLRECASFLQQHRPPGGYRALGVATFGPAGVNPSQKERYGTILASSPKQAWRKVDLLSPLVAACQGPTNNHELPVRFETDVNAPALAEFEHERSRLQNLITSLAYVTVGTGVGVGLVVNSKPIHGRMHPEGGHVAVQPLENDAFGGYSWGSDRSPYRGKHTVEGITSSVALTERLAQIQQHHGKDSDLSRDVLSGLPDDHEVWDHAANALANLCVTLLLTTSMEKIVLGGGVMRRTVLMDKIRSRTVDLLNGYLELPDDMAELITTSTWGDDAGLMGAVVLAQKAFEEEQPTPSCRRGPCDSYTRGFVGGVIIGGALVALLMTRSSPRL